MLIAFTILSFIFIIHWIGLLFGLKMFNHFAELCRDAWFWVFACTCTSIYNTYQLFTKPEYAEHSILWFVIFLNTFMVLGMVGEPIAEAVYKFHKNQKIKRGNV